MLLIDEEREARDNDSILVGVASYGDDNLTGSLVSCAVVLDYNKITPKIVEQTLSGVFTQDIQTDITNAIRVVYTYKLDAIKLNAIGDMTVAKHITDFRALNGCVFAGFSKLSNDPDFVISETPIKEVIKNKDLSLYTTKSTKSSYVVLDKWNQFKNLIPGTKFSVPETAEVFTLLFAKAFARTSILQEELEQHEKYKGYTFGTKTLTEEQVAFLDKNGLTEYHRAFMPGMDKFVFSKNILI